MSLTFLELAHQTEFEGALFTAQDGNAYIHCHIPPETFECCVPQVRLEHFDYAGYERLTERNIGKFMVVLEKKYRERNYTMLDRAGSTRPLVTITAEDITNARLELTGTVFVRL